MTTEPDDLTGLPGAEWIRRGLTEAREGRWTAEALAVAVAPTRLRALGLDVAGDLPQDVEIALYMRLHRDGVDDPYARYNALLRELDSFIEALEGRRRRERAA